MEDNYTNTSHNICDNPTNIISNYLQILDNDLIFLSKDTKGALEEEMKNAQKKMVLEKHPYKLPSPESYATGRQKTRVPDPLSNENRKTIWANSEEEMFEKLYEHYFNTEYTFEKVFEQMCNERSLGNNVLPKTIQEYKKDYKRFFAGTTLASKDIRRITVKDMSIFLRDAHLKVSDTDTKRGFNCIEKHRHYAIRTIINKTFIFANQYLNAYATNPLSGSIEYDDFPYYSMESEVENDFYTTNDIIKLLEVFDSIEKPTCAELAVGVIFETLTRNGEVRALRFKDFHFEEEQPYVRFCGLANGSIREDRIKSNSSKGKRNLAMTPRLERIYEKAKLASWSDEYMFVRNKNDVDGDNILVTMQAVQRALMRMCKQAGIHYLPPHQIRFAGATQMLKEGADIYTVQGQLGHTTPTMSAKYADRVKNAKISVGPKWTQICENKKRTENQCLC